MVLIICTGASLPISSYVTLTSGLAMWLDSKKFEKSNRWWPQHKNWRSKCDHSIRLSDGLLFSFSVLLDLWNKTHLLLLLYLLNRLLRNIINRSLINKQTTSWFSKESHVNFKLIYTSLPRYNYRPMQCMSIRGLCLWLIVVGTDYWHPSTQISINACRTLPHHLLLLNNHLLVLHLACY